MRAARRTYECRSWDSVETFPYAPTCPRFFLGGPLFISGVEYTAFGRLADNIGTHKFVRARHVGLSRVVLQTKVPKLGDVPAE